MSISDQNCSSPPSRGRTVLLKSRKGAIRGGIGVFVVYLILAIIVRGSQLRALGWTALSMLLGFDLLIAFGFALLGALVGGVAGAILAMQGPSPSSNNEPLKHPLD